MMSTPDPTLGVRMSPTVCRSRRSKLAVGAAIVAAGVAAWAVPAGAHLEPTPWEVEGGETTTITFTVPHGCDGSPTTKLVIQLAEGVTGAQPGNVDGWKGSVSGREVTFEGGPLADDEQLGFPITMTMPAQEGYILFPTVQTCEKGETHWIEVQKEGEDEPKYPAPVIHLTAPAMTPISVPEDEVAQSGVENTTVPADGNERPTPIKAAETEDTDDGGKGQLIGIVAIVAAAAVAITAIVVRRKDGDKDGEKGGTGGAGDGGSA